MFTNRFYEYILRLLKIVLCIEREASERTFHCQPTLNVRSDTGYILKVVTTGFTIRPDVGCGRNRGVKDDSKIFGLSHWRNGVTTTEMGKTKGRFGVRSQFGTWKFKFLKTFNSLCLSFLGVKEEFIILHIIIVKIWGVNVYNSTIEKASRDKNKLIKNSY